MCAIRLRSVSKDLFEQDVTTTTSSSELFTTAQTTAGTHNKAHSLIRRTDEDNFFENSFTAHKTTRENESTKEKVTLHRVQ